jgi:hypothetical protein
MAIGVQDYLRRRWRIAPTSDELLAELPDTFRYSEALERISERQLRRLLSDGQITALARGLYRKSDWLGDDDLIEIAALSTGQRNTSLAIPLAS